MISEKRKHELNLNYKLIGDFIVNEDGSFVVNIFEGQTKEKFDDFEKAMSFLHRKILLFQRNMELPLSVSVKRKNRNDTYWLFPNSELKDIIEIPAYHYNRLNFSVDKKKRAHKSNQLNPNRITFNGIARRVTHQEKKWIVARSLILASFILSAFALMGFNIYYSIHSTQAMDSAAYIKDVPVMQTSTLAYSILIVIMVSILLFLFLRPIFVRHKTLRDETGKRSFKNKSFKKAYRVAFMYNFLRIPFIIFNSALLILISFSYADTIFVESFDSIPESKILLSIFGVLVVSTTLFIITSTYMSLRFRQLRTTLLETYVPKDEQPLFTAWIYARKLDEVIYKFDTMHTYYYYPVGDEELQYISKDVYHSKDTLTDFDRNRFITELEEDYKKGLKKYKTYKIKNRKSIGV